MRVLRLEELLRTLAIALLSVLVGICAFFVDDAIHATPGTHPGLLGLVIASMVIFAVAFPIACIAGFLLHFVLRFLTLPRIALLPIFLVTSYVAYRVKGIPDTLVMALSIGCAAWVLYGWGPVSLWSYEFDPERHGDF